MNLTESQDALFVELDDSNPSRQQVLVRDALMRMAEGDLAGAMELSRQAESLARQENDAMFLAIALGNQAEVLQTQGNIEGAIQLVKEKEAVCRQRHDPRGLASALLHHARILAFDLARAKDALPLAEEAHRLAKEHRLFALAGQIEPIVEQIRSLSGR